MAGDDLGPQREVAHELEELLVQQPRTGLRDALVRVGPVVAQGAPDVLDPMAAAVERMVRAGDGVSPGAGDDLLVLLRGVHDIPVALAVARKICVAAGEVAPAAAGVTLINRGESATSALVRARGALDLAREAGAGQVISSPLWP
mgnify:CR=1 FL=1